MTTSSAMIDSLPRDFDFYHLGRVTLSEERTQTLSLDDRIAVAFSLNGDTPGLLVLLLDGGLDVSTYSEAGNIIASHLATSLAARDGREVTISPPRVIARERLQLLLEGGAASARTYLHHLRSHTIRLTAIVLETRTGNA